VLEDENQVDVIRHEAAEAIGAIGGAENVAFLRKFVSHNNQAIAETC
jgi:deoxyhypusine monooxygenase